MIFVDSNIPMYLVGAEHPHKHDAHRVLTSLVADNEPLATDVEVFQELLHRYAVEGQFPVIQDAFDALLAIVDEVLGFGLVEIEAAKDILQSTGGISARDALHIAVMRANDIDRIFSFDRGFDRYPGVERLS